MADGDGERSSEQVDERPTDKLEAGLGLLSRTWLAIVVISWLSVGWTSGGRHHLVQPLVVLLSPLALAGLARMRAGARSRARDLLSLTVVVALALAVLDPVLGYLRGTIASAGLPFVGLPFFTLAMWAWTKDRGLGPSACRPWLRALLWSTPFAVIVSAVWAALVLRGLASGHWGEIDVDGAGPVFLFLISVGVLLPGALISTWVATRDTRRRLHARPHRRTR
jgi:hypothetical protein